MVSLKRRIFHRPAMWTSWDTEALSAALNGKGSQPQASPSAWPMTPPWVKTATVCPGCPAHDAVQRSPDARREGSRWLGSGNDVPALLTDHAHGYRVTFNYAHPPHVPLPFPEVSLAQVMFSDRGNAQPIRQRRGGLGGPPEARHVDRGDGLAGQPVGQPFRLPPPGRAQFGIAVAGQERKRHGGVRAGRLSVAQDQQLSRSFGNLEAILLDHSAVGRDRLRTVHQRQLTRPRRCSDCSIPARRSSMSCSVIAVLSRKEPNEKW